MLASCAGTTPSVPGALRPGASSSWMSASAKGETQLLYVSDLGTFDVYVYRFPSLKLLGRLTGFNDPQGECTDAAGNVWIANTKQNDVIEYAHGGTTPVATLRDPTGFPVGCATDRASGDLAVTNLDGFSGAGSVLVYKRARGTPKTFANPNQYYYYFAAYDGKGDLYVSGQSRNGAYLLSVLARGSSSMSLVSIAGGALYFPGTVAWNGSKLVLGDQKCAKKASSCFYGLSVSGRRARITGTTPLKGSCDVAEAWVGATQIAGGDDAEYCARERSGVAVWPYPRGGSPSASAAGPRIPVGATVSDISAGTFWLNPHSSRVASPAGGAGFNTQL